MNLRSIKTIQEHTQWARDMLASQNLPDAQLSAQLLLAHVCTCSREDLIRNATLDVSPSLSERYRMLIELRSRDVPLSYLTQEKEFYGLKFFVDENVLIPRPETELLIEAFSKQLPNTSLRICDVGSGSGAIAITVKKLFPNLKVTAVDISEKALAVAVKNAKNLGVDVEWIHSNLLDQIDQKFDFVLANLPYIPSHEISALPSSVRCEPRLALDGGKDGLDFYRKLISQLDHKLEKGGRVFFEIGKDQGFMMRQLLDQHHFFEVRILKDYAGLDRVVTARKSRV